MASLQTFYYILFNSIDCLISYNAKLPSVNDENIKF